MTCGRATTRIALVPEKPVRYRTFARFVTMRPSRWDDDSVSTSAARRDGRRSTTRERRDEAAQAELVTVRAETAEHRAGAARQRRLTPLRLPRVDVCQVDLDVRNRYRGQRITQCETRVAVGASIDEHAAGAATHGMDGVDHRPFPVELGEVDLDAELG